MQVCTIGCTMGNQKQKGQSDGSDSDWTLRHPQIFLVFLILSFLSPAAFQHILNDQICHI